MGMSPLPQLVKSHLLLRDVSIFVPVELIIFITTKKRFKNDWQLWPFYDL
jgi:hypothetical protein